MIIWPLVFQHSASSVTAMQHAVYNFVVCAHAQTKTCSYSKGQKPQAFKNVTPAVLPYKKQKSPWKGSEIF